MTAMAEYQAHRQQCRAFGIDIAEQPGDSVKTRPDGGALIPRRDTPGLDPAAAPYWYFSGDCVVLVCGRAHQKPIHRSLISPEGEVPAAMLIEVGGVCIGKGASLRCPREYCAYHHQRVFLEGYPEL
jgi:hypothetical protein